MIGKYPLILAQLKPVLKCKYVSIVVVINTVFVCMSLDFITFLTFGFGQSAKFTKYRIAYCEISCALLLEEYQKYS